MSDKTDVTEAAKSRLEKAKNHWDPIYELGKEDLRFLSDEPLAQWDPVIAQTRKAAGLQCLTLDQCGQFVHQVSNDIRQNTPSIDVIPDGEGSDEETAKKFKGIIRGIEYESGADAAYDMAANNAIKARIGFIRVDHDYVNDQGFEQKLCIKRVINPFSCYIDPSSVEIDGRDAEWGFSLETMSVGEFRSRWPDAEPVSFEGGDKGKSPSEIKDDDEIVVAEYFTKSYSRTEKGLRDDGQIEDVAEGVQYKSRRKVSKTVIERYMLSGAAELEKTTFPGKYIPLVPVYGEEAWEDGERKLQSLISKAKPAQQLYNLWASIETDMITRANRSPVFAAEGSVEPFAKDYANPDGVPFLRYKAYNSDGKPLPAPTRAAPFQIPTGIVNARREALDDIKAATGMYNASIGQKSNETSGIAIQRRQAEGDVATLHFGDNLVKSITHVGRILVSAAPEIYDTPRILTALGSEDKVEKVGINGAIAEGQEQTVTLAQGQYSVRVTTGPSYTTKRQEAFASLSELFRGSPELVQLYGDLYFKNGDFAGADALAERAKKMLPPQLQDEEGIDPQVQQLTQQNQELQQVAQALQAELQKKDETGQMQQQMAKANLENAELKAAMSLMQKERSLEAQENQLKLLEQKLQNIQDDMAEKLAVIEAAQQAAPESGAYA